MTITVRSAGDLGLESIERIAFRGDRVVLTPEALQHVAGARAAAVAALQRGDPVYGVTTELGYKASVVVDAAGAAAHERRLLLGRAVGSPPYLPAAEARAVLAVRLAGFLTGRAGVTPDLCELLAACLNSGFTPAIPRGSVGCAGEIIPLAHAFGALMGVGSVLGPDGRAGSAAEGLAARGLGPFEPQPKEGIALLGGAPGVTALGIARLREARSYAGSGLLSAAAAIDAASAPLDPYTPALGHLSGDALLEDVLSRLHRLLDGAGPGRTLQAPVSFRVVPQVQVHLERSVSRLEEDVRRALRAVTDSPALVDGGFVSSGGFHQIEVAAAMDGLAAALARAGEAAGQRLHRLLDGRFTGLPDQLSPGPGCGLVVVHKRAVGSLNELRRLAAPASLGSADTSLGQEDVMTFGFEAAEKLRRALSLGRKIAACELLTAFQAWWLRRRAGGRPPAPGFADLEALLAEAVGPVEEDRPLGDDLGRMAALVEQGKLPGATA
jgi:histidine ammonia-lyase